MISYLVGACFVITSLSFVWILVGQVRRVSNALRYDSALNRLEIPPNGDDYNTIIEMLKGAVYQEPHREGR